MECRKIIIVTGTARTGTSLMMQTLMHLGIKVSGDRFSAENSCVECNKRGYYELPIDELIDGIDPIKYQYNAVKIFGHQLFSIPSHHIDKLFICRRNKDDTIKSIINWLGKQTFLSIAPTKSNAEFLWNIHYESIDSFLEFNKSVEFLNIKFEEMLSYPTKTIIKIVDFLCIDTDILKAVRNVGL